MLASSISIFGCSVLVSLQEALQKLTGLIRKFDSLTVAVGVIQPSNVVSNIRKCETLRDLHTLDEVLLSPMRKTG